MKRYHLNYNYIVADFVSLMNRGILRKLRFIKIVKTRVAIQLLIVLYKQGVIRSFKVHLNYISVYFKFFHGRPLGKLSLISRPGKRCY